MSRRAFLRAVLSTCAWGAWLRSSAARAAENLDSEHAEDRVGRRFWARPGDGSTSVDFYAERELRSRRPVYAKTALRVTDIEAVDAAAGQQIVYRVRFEDATEAFIAVVDFDRRLYRELAPNQVMSAPPDSPVGAAPHLWIFRRSSLFASDPDVIWERIRNEGPRTFKPARPPRKQPPADRPAKPVPKP